MTPEEFRKWGHEVIDLVADYREHVVDRNVRADVQPGEIKASLPASPPEVGEPFDVILADVDKLVMPGLTHWQHPRFFGYFPSTGTFASVLGDVLSTGLNVIGLSWASSPALSEVEEVVTDWVRQMLGLSHQWTGVIQDTASTSTLVALMCARERTSAYGLARGGLQGEHQPLVIYASAQSHSSVEKAALLSGFGKENLRLIGCDDHYAMRPDLLRQAIEEDVRAGRRPCAVVATSGTTAVTAFDPLVPIGEIASQFSMWMHVDAAMAGSAMICPEMRGLWEGVEHADSLVVNAHKWLGAAFDCSLYYVRDASHLVRVMSTNPSYLQSAADDRVRNLRDWGLPLGRRFRALKLWFLVREQGVAALQARIRRDLGNARWLADALVREEGWRLLAPVTLQTLVLRHEPPGLTGEALDAYTLAWTERVNASGAAYLTPAVLDGRWMVRVSIGAEQTERRHVEELLDILRSAVSAT